MKPRSFTRQFGAPELSYLDDREAVEHFYGRSPETLLRWESLGLKIHTIRIGSRHYRFIKMAEYLSWLATQEVA